MTALILCCSLSLSPARCRTPGVQRGNIAQTPRFPPLPAGKGRKICVHNSTFLIETTETPP